MQTPLSTVRAVCPHDCPDTCGLVVTVENGRAVKLRGDKEHPFTKGFLCQKVSHYLDRVYHRDRLLYPMKRDGPQAILPYSYAGTMGKLMYGSLDRRFFHRLGASLLDRTICATAGVAGSEVTLGTRAFIDPEATVHSRYIINWGSNTAVTNIHHWAV